MSAKCRICSNETTILNDPQFQMSYSVCSVCCFIRKNDPSPLTPEEEKAHYSLHDNTFESKGYVQMFKNFIDKGIRPYSLHKGLALDFGCGPGPVLATLLKDLGYEVDTYDIHFEPNTGYTEKRYDLITATEILEHLDDPLPVIMSLKNLLNQNGVLAFMTRFHSNDPEAFLNWWYRRDKTHISFYTPKTFRYIAEKASLKILLTDERDTCILSRL